MTPKLAATLKMHEPDAASALLGPRPVRDEEAPITARPPPRLRLIEGRVEPIPSSHRWQALHRRCLGTADVLASTVALSLILVVSGGARPGAIVLAGMPLVVLLFKVAGLYDRDQMRLWRATLDDVPLPLH